MNNNFVIFHAQLIINGHLIIFVFLNTHVTYYLCFILNLIVFILIKQCRIYYDNVVEKVIKQ